MKTCKRCGTYLEPRLFGDPGLHEECQTEALTEFLENINGICIKLKAGERAEGKIGVSAAMFDREGRFIVAISAEVDQLGPLDLYLSSLTRALAVALRGEIEKVGMGKKGE